MRRGTAGVCKNMYGLFASTLAIGAVPIWQRSSAQVEKQIAQLGLKPLPDTQLATLVKNGEDFVKVADKPSGWLSGAVVIEQPSSLKPT